MMRVFWGLLLACTMGPKKRPAASSAPALCPLDQTSLYSKLATAGTSKTGLVDAVSALKDAGWLHPSVVENCTTSTVTKRLKTASLCHCTAETPYGKVVQSMPLPLDKLPHWEYAHPLALLYYLSKLSGRFGDLMAKCNTPGVALGLIIYIDEICPGNPLRPEKSRTLHAIYWAIADWPQWLLQRTAAWPCFGTIRSKLVDEFLPGGVSALMRRIMEVFFAVSGPSFSKGVELVMHGRDNLLVTAKFCGFLADEKAHNQICNSKGASGTKCCINCNNVFNRVPHQSLVDGVVCIKCTDMLKFRCNTDADVHAFYDHIAAAQLAGLSPDDYDSMTQMLGIKLNPHGLMASLPLRSVYKPVTHCLRDWMHTLVSHGVANVQCARVI
jgi:hypothetical protein